MGQKIEICCFVLVAVLVQQAFPACQELQPVQGFTNDFMQGKYYWLLQKIAYDNQDEAKCGMTYSFVDGNIWTYIDMTKKPDGSEDFVKEVGHMDTPGHWNVSTFHPDGTPFTYSLTALGGKPKKWLFLYSCNPANGEFAMWLFYYKRVRLDQIDRDAHDGVKEIIKKNNLSTQGIDRIDNSNCPCK